MRYSDNYNLKLPQRGVDRANVDDLDDNFGIIDGALADDRQISLLMYDSTATYNTGAIRGYENPTTHRVRAYRCLEDNVTGPWDATKWAQTTLAAEIENGGGGGGSSTLAGLSDVDLGTPADGEVLTYDATEGKWVNAEGGSGGASELSDLDDVSLTTPTEGQILTYDGDEWVNTDAPDVDVTKTASGNPIEISDSANAPLVKCVTEIQGSQDLHGYDKPWVGGAGKNKADISDNTKSNYQNCTVAYADNGVVISATGNYSRCGFSIPVETGRTITITLYAYKNVGSYGRIVFSDTEGEWGSASAYETIDTNGIRTKYNRTYTTTSNVLFIGFYATTTQSSGDFTIDSVMVEYSDQATDFEPYSNICPITAYTENTISVGTKLLDDAIYHENAYLDANGNITENVSYEFTETYTSVQQIEYSVYCNKIDSNEMAISVAFYDNSKNFTHRIIVIFGSQTGLFGGTFTPLQNDKFVRINFPKVSTNKTLYVGTEQETTHTTTFPSAIFRGSEDVINGTETHDMIAIDLGDLTWIKASDGNYYTMSLDGFVHFNEVEATALCENYSLGTYAHWSNKTRDSIILGVSATKVIYVRDSRFTELTDFENAISGVKLAYTLATPTTSSVTPTNLPIKSLNGYSHIESSTGEMEIEYIAKAFSPITELVDSQISALQKMMELMLTSARETEMVASANYTTGTLIVACGALYKATTAISSGASLVVGTNITPTTIAAELAALA